MDHAYRIRCSCGGLVVRLNDDAVMYILRDDKSIVFRGVCNQCGQEVESIHAILALYLVAPGLDTVH